MSELYEDDILLWSERQADLLRRHATDQRDNDLALDRPNIIEEIVSMGHEQLHAVESLLPRALIHRLKAGSWPETSDGVPPRSVPDTCPVTLDELLASA